VANGMTWSRDHLLMGSQRTVLPDLAVMGRQEQHLIAKEVENCSI
jgi:hypothetical protein